MIIEDILANRQPIEHILEFTLEEARQIKSAGVIAFKVSDQGWSDLLCRNGKIYSHCSEDIDFGSYFNIPIVHFREIRFNTYPGWTGVYCGVGHFVIMRDEYYFQFKAITQGMFNPRRWEFAYDVLMYLASNSSTPCSLPIDI